MFGKKQKTIDALIEENKRLNKEILKYCDRLAEESNHNAWLSEQHIHLTTLFEKEEDVNIIKYGNKLFYITSRVYSKEYSGDETLDITAIRVGEVDEDDKG